ncbi:ribonuclease HII [Chloroflexota bacterium]
MVSGLIPSLEEEQLLLAQGYRLIAGVDEAGRGALAGPVVAAAVILPAEIKTDWAEQVRDSKMLRQSVREFLSRGIQEIALSVGIGAVSHEDIDDMGIARASRLAMKIAIERLSPEPQYVLVDYFNLPEVALPQKGLVDGDAICFSIACASIIAKVARDNMMQDFDVSYQGYGFARHKGYGTREHQACLSKLGVSPIHRRSFRPVREIIYRQ